MRPCMFWRSARPVPQSYCVNWASDSTISVEAAEKSSCRHRCPWTSARGSCVRSSAAADPRGRAAFCGQPSAAIKPMQRCARPERRAGALRWAPAARARVRRSRPRRLVEATPTSRWPSSRQSCSGASGSACLSTIHKALRRIGFGIKKSLRRPSKTARRRRQTPAMAGLAAFMDPARFVFLDETAPPPTWPGAVAAALQVGVWSRPCRMAIGAPRPSSLGSGTAASSHRWCSTGR